MLHPGAADARTAYLQSTETDRTLREGAGFVDGHDDTTRFVPGCGDPEVGGAARAGRAGRG